MALLLLGGQPRAASVFDSEGFCSHIVPRGTPWQLHVHSGGDKKRVSRPCSSGADRWTLPNHLESSSTARQPARMGTILSWNSSKRCRVREPRRRHGS